MGRTANVKESWAQAIWLPKKRYKRRVRSKKAHEAGRQRRKIQGRVKRTFVPHEKRVEKGEKRRTLLGLLKIVNVLWKTGGERLTEEKYKKKLQISREGTCGSGD